MAKKNVLLVDDDLDLLKIVGERIKGWGFELTEAQDGGGAIELCQNQSPDIIVLDYMLPDMDGLAVLKEIRRINKSVPVVMFTAYPNMKTIQDADKLGISAFVPKFSVYADIQQSLKVALDMIQNEGKDK